MKFDEVVINIDLLQYYILMKKIIVLYQTHLRDGPSVKGRWIEP